MSDLNSFELDALNELFNIGLHRAAATLSTLTSQRVIVDLPELWVCPVAELDQRLAGLVSGELATVHQLFRGHGEHGRALPHLRERTLRGHRLLLGDLPRRRAHLRRNRRAEARTR